MNPFKPPRNFESVVRELAAGLEDGTIVLNEGGESMSLMNFDQVWEAVKTLPSDQQRRLRRLLNALRFKRQPLTPEDELQLLLLKDGVIDGIPRPPTDAENKAYEEYKPVPIEGKPLSETIIEERR
ncbi:MAG TPA: hypothetical protein VN688_19475 [Gemmataceae bacterium]|nr:hypothetical protein [Gemmataceae bacterium]